jgi:hypothetical protein
MQLLIIAETGRIVFRLLDKVRRGVSPCELVLLSTGEDRFS